MYLLLKVAMKEGIWNIKLSHRPIKAKSNGQHKSNSGRFNHKTKCLL